MAKKMTRKEALLQKIRGIVADNESWRKAHLHYSEFGGELRDDLIGLLYFIRRSRKP